MHCSSGMATVAAFVIRMTTMKMTPTPVPAQAQRTTRRTKLLQVVVHDNITDEDDSDSVDELFMERFRRRRAVTLSKSKITQSIQFERKLPNDPIKLAVISILDSLSRPHFPIPYSGYKVLYEGSTPHWQAVLRKSVGASGDTDETFFLTALSASMERPYNQFGILVGVVEDYNKQKHKYFIDDNAEIDNNNGDCTYKLEFPRDTLDYYDGTAWVECRLRDVHSDALLVVLGWSMKQQEGGNDSPVWLVDGIDWQDFREKYRPGIGREEWERICG